MTTVLAKPHQVRTSRGLRPLLGPAFIAAVAYVDPGNFASNFEAGSRFGYDLLWVLVMANVMAMIVQYTSAKVGLATGQSLPELCRSRFSVRSNRVLWVQAELVAMATDLAEFVGAAVGLHLLFGLPLLAGGLVTAVVSVAMLVLQHHGARRFQTTVIAMLAIVLGGFIVQTVFVVGAQPPAPADLAAGLIPSIGEPGTAGVAIAIIGATVMPHVIYLHSALTQDLLPNARQVPLQVARRMVATDTIVALGVAGLINTSMLVVAAGAFHETQAGGVTLNGIHAHLGDRFGELAAGAFAVALSASGLASAGVGSYAGQVVMQGFTTWRIPISVRRTATMLPALAVLTLGLDPGQVLILSQMVLSFGIPFALIPLLIIAADRSRMKELTSTRTHTVTLTVVATVIISLNLVALGGLFHAG